MVWTAIYARREEGSRKERGRIGENDGEANRKAKVKSQKSKAKAKGCSGV
jgi:hypothetical protein